MIKTLLVLLGVIGFTHSYSMDAELWRHTKPANHDFQFVKFKRQFFTRVYSKTAPSHHVRTMAVEYRFKWKLDREQRFAFAKSLHSSKGLKLFKTSKTSRTFQKTTRYGELLELVIDTRDPQKTWVFYSSIRSGAYKAYSELGQLKAILSAPRVSASGLSLLPFSSAHAQLDLGGSGIGSLFTDLQEAVGGITGAAKELQKITALAQQPHLLVAGIQGLTVALKLNNMLADTVINLGGKALRFIFNGFRSTSKRDVAAKANKILDKMSELSAKRTAMMRKVIKVERYLQSMKGPVRYSFSPKLNPSAISSARLALMGMRLSKYVSLSEKGYSFDKEISQLEKRALEDYRDIEAVRPTSAQYSNYQQTLKKFKAAEKALEDGRKKRLSVDKIRVLERSYNYLKVDKETAFEPIEKFRSALEFNLKYAKDTVKEIDKKLQNRPSGEKANLKDHDILRENYKNFVHKKLLADVPSESKNPEQDHQDLGANIITRLKSGFGAYYSPQLGRFNQLLKTGPQDKISKLKLVEDMLLELSSGKPKGEKNFGDNSVTQELALRRVLFNHEKEGDFKVTEIFPDIGKLAEKAIQYVKEVNALVKARNTKTSSLVSQVRGDSELLNYTKAYLKQTGNTDPYDYIMSFQGGGQNVVNVLNDLSNRYRRDYHLRLLNFCEEKLTAFLQTSEQVENKIYELEQSFFLYFKEFAKVYQRALKKNEKRYRKKLKKVYASANKALKFLADKGSGRWIAPAKAFLDAQVKELNTLDSVKSASSSNKKSESVVSKDWKENGKEANKKVIAAIEGLSRDLGKISFSACFTDIKKDIPKEVTGSEPPASDETKKSERSKEAPGKEQLNPCPMLAFQETLEKVGVEYPKMPIDLTNKIDALDRFADSLYKRYRKRYEKAKGIERISDRVTKRKNETTEELIEGHLVELKKLEDAVHDTVVKAAENATLSKEAREMIRLRNPVHRRYRQAICNIYDHCKRFEGILVLDPTLPDMDWVKGQCFDFERRKQIIADQKKKKLIVPKINDQGNSGTKKKGSKGSKS